ncbi:MAG TPA: class I SAM-dependent methyltransferase [bacterium]|nr:class I SAM-dependent methyltransferase [bacterium]
MREEPQTSGIDDLVSESDRFGFWRFARHPFFTDINRWLVQRVASLGPRVVDLACGPGAITELILASVKERSRLLIYAVDPSLAELDRARRRIASGLVKFIQGGAENLSRLVPQVDVVIFCNAIHLVADKNRALAEIRKVLGPGGTLAFNTTYFKGCYVPGTERFWRYWALRAAQYLRRRGFSVLRTGKTQAMEWFTPEEYDALAASSGFVQASWHLHKATLSPESLEDIGQFSMFIEGALPGVPLEIGAEALRESVRAAMNDVHLSDGVPRYWLQFIAQAPA